ncbi:hypothetical protein LOK49_LG11G00836 [Camellia lanceoleosa]|uniref:Uncharacterized protein n=1 Tax=Camellia lanceoleosa TaxID=1840588 RepID=A0ACC0G1U8_9ERIC|nr:hypothetical protein LOK49_LG11G00836 [Camellia lanceoleosa]
MPQLRTRGSRKLEGEAVVEGHQNSKAKLWLKEINSKLRIPHHRGTSSHCICSEKLRCNVGYNVVLNVGNNMEASKMKETCVSFPSLPSYSTKIMQSLHLDGAGVLYKQGQRAIVATSPPIEDAVIATEPLMKEDLVGYLASGCTEHEKFGFEFGTLQPMKGILLTLMDMKRNGGKNQSSASEIVLGMNPRASIGVQSEVPTPSSFVKAMGRLCSEIRDLVQQQKLCFGREVVSSPAVVHSQVWLRIYGSIAWAVRNA